MVLRPGPSPAPRGGGKGRSEAVGLYNEFSLHAIAALRASADLVNTNVCAVAQPMYAREMRPPAPGAGCGAGAGGRSLLWTSDGRPARRAKGGGSSHPWRRIEQLSRAITSVGNLKQPITSAGKCWPFIARICEVFWRAAPTS